MMLLLAQTAAERAGRLRSLQDRFAEPAPGVGSRILLFFLLLLAAVIVVWLAAYFQRRRVQGIRPQPMALFVRVQRRLGLPFWSRWRMKRLAQIVGIDQPTALLISPGLFDQAVEQYCAGRGLLGSRTGTAVEFARIREQIFGRLPQEGQVALVPPVDYNPG